MSAVLHAPDAFGDARTLCGEAYEGACVGNKEDDELPVVAEGQEVITCPHCRMIIDHCKRFKRYKLS